MSTTITSPVIDYIEGNVMVLRRESPVKLNPDARVKTGEKRDETSTLVRDI